MAHAADHAIDAVGLVCPEPLMIVRNKVRSMAPGETVSVVATDPSTVRDFTNFCRFMGHELARSTRDGELYSFVIRKGAGLAGQGSGGKPGGSPSPMSTA